MAGIPVNRSDRRRQLWIIRLITPLFDEQQEGQTTA